MDDHRRRYLCHCFERRYRDSALCGGPMGRLDRPLTDSFASYLPGGWALYIGSMVEPVRRPRLTSRHRRFKRLPGSSDRGISGRVSAGLFRHLPEATAEALQSMLFHLEEIDGIPCCKQRGGTLTFQSSTVADLQEPRHHTLPSFRSA